MNFFEWAVQRERENCWNIVKNQKQYCPSIPISETIQNYEKGHVKIYKPENDKVLGHIFNIHGGGLIAGSVAQNRNFCLWLAEHGYAVYAIEYPLIPEVTFEEQVRNICNVILLLSEDIHGWKYLVADSAGCLLGLVVNAILSADGHWMTEYFGFNLNNYRPCYFNGVWLCSPMIETIGFNKIGIFMAKHYYGGKGWKTKPFIRFLKKPYDWFLEYLPCHTVITSSKKDELYKQSKKLWKKLKCAFIFESGKEYEHDWNVIDPFRDIKTKSLNEFALQEMIL